MELYKTTTPTTVGSESLMAVAYGFPKLACWLQFNWRRVTVMASGRRLRY